MAVKLCYNRVEQFCDGSGIPYSGAKLFTYTAGSTTKQTTYTESTGSTPNTNPIVLDSAGRLPQPVWLTAGVNYKLVLAPSTDTDPPASPIWTLDNISGINDTTSALNEWIAGPAPTYISATSFSLSGDQTTTFHVGRRLKTTNTAGTVYSTITASVFGALTTVTVENDSGTLDSGLSAVSYGIISQSNDSDPAFTDQAPIVVNKTDRTKRVRISASGITTGKTRVLTIPNEDFTIGPFARGVISGFTYANNGADSIDIAAGGAADSTNAYSITGAALTKNITLAWAVGNAAGMLDTGAVGNSDYYLWAIARSDTGVVDYLSSLSSTAPTMPANYDFKRLIGWFKRVGGTIVAFHTYEISGGGLQLNWDAPTLDVNLANTLTTARRTDAIKVPLNFSVVAQIVALMYDAGSAFYAWVGCPDQTDVAPSGTAALLANFSFVTAMANGEAKELHIRTSATGTIAARATLATVDLYEVSTMGFSWGRR